MRSFSRRPAPARLIAAAALALFLLAPAAATRPALAQSLDLDRERSRQMLNIIKGDLKKNYYDPSFRGVDIEARFKAADEKLKQAGNRGTMFAIIAQAMLDLNDSHTFFMPPQLTVRAEYGWQMQMIGDHCYVSAVKPGSDAEKKGLRPGDRILSLDGYQPNRNILWKLQYLYYTLKPSAGMSLAVEPPAGQPRQLEVLSKVIQEKLVVDLTKGEDYWTLVREAENMDRLNRHRYVEMGADLLIWKMPAFDLSKSKVDDMMSKAKKFKALVLDLRGNGGGYEETMLQLLGSIFDRDVTVGEVKRRKETKPLVAKTRGEAVFKGDLIVLVDSRSGSASELLARVVQLEKRGTVIGDRTAGAVMRSRSYDYKMGTDSLIFYGASITDADIVMTDGKSLEGEGVAPDKLMLPTAADMAAGRDPVLSHAASLAGIKLEPEKAGALFPIEWRK